jgi:YD repeat-containing protein
MNKEYDEKGNVIHSKDSNGYEKWNEYDENGNLLNTKNND